MAQIGTVFVSSVTYSVSPVPGTDSTDLTNPNGNGIDFPQPQGTTGLFDQNNKPLYTIDVTFNPSGVNSLSSITVNKNTNVQEFSVEFFELSNPTQLVTNPNQPGVPVSYTSSLVNDIASIVNFPKDTPSDLSGIRITILSTTNIE
jgi:hypothetical protein